MRLRQSRLRRAIRLGHRGGANGEGSDCLRTRSRLASAANSDPEFSARAVYNLAIQGDEEAKKIFARVGRGLGICIANLVNAFNLPMYVVGGGVASAWEAFSPFVFQELRQRSLVYATTASTPPLFDRHGRSLQKQSQNSPARPRVTRALLGSDAGLYGAALLPMMSRA